MGNNGHLSLVDLERMRIPPRYFRACIDEIHLSKSKETAARMVECIQKDVHYAAGLLLVGLSGVGKTYMAVSILKRLKATLSGFTGFFVEASELNKNFLFTEFDDDFTYLERCKRVNLLVINRFGFEDKQYFPHIFEIVTSRINSLRPTIIITDWNLKDLDGRYPNFLQSIYSSILPVHIEGELYSEKEREKFINDLQIGQDELRQSTSLKDN